MKFIRKHRKLSVFILIILVLFVFFGSTFARYIYNKIDNFILETKDFYFNSSILSTDTSLYKITNWDGVNSYTLNIDVNNKKNELKSTNSDIKYDISFECPDTVNCSLSKKSGIIYKDSKTDSYTITVTPKSNFYAGDEVEIITTAVSSYPYKKTLSAKYTIGVEKSKFSYEIVDSINSKILTLKLTNSISYYEVERAFSSFKVGDQISFDTYNGLSDSEKDNCFSSKVTITIPVDKLYLDMSSDSYINRISGSDSFVTINNFNYVSSYSFKVDANSSKQILFYKEDISKNYTYPIINNTSIIDLNVLTAK